MPRPDNKAENAPLRLGVLISGGGRSLQNLIDRIQAGALRATIEIVVSSRREVAGVQKAEAAGISCSIVREKDSTNHGEFSAAITRCLRNANVDLVVLAGFMVLWKIPEEFSGRVINIHPALIPDHCGKGLYGMRVHTSVIRSGDTMSGCTVHYADNQYDHGPVILQRLVPVEHGDTPETLARRVFEAECKALPQAIQMIANEKVWQEGHEAVFAANATAPRT